MANVKTAISLQKALLEQIDALAEEMKISRSRLFTLALEDYILRHQNRQLLERINQSYEGATDATGQKRTPKMQRLHRRVVKGEW
jgi:metal-responsive CopG/Arc/MetJ family transcriptional regulator